MKITITRALTELKTLRSRYTDQLIDLKPIAVKQGSKLRSPYASYKPEDFEKQILPGLQSVEALYKRMVDIKTKIDQSNSVTKVTIGSSEMTIQEALVMKSYVNLKEQMLENLKSYQSQARREYERALEDNRKYVERMVQNATSSSGTPGGKVDPETERKALESVESLYKVDFVDSGKLSERIEKLTKEIEEFKSNVDYALSESNSTTFIEIDD